MICPFAFSHSNPEEGICQNVDIFLSKLPMSSQELLLSLFSSSPTVTPSGSHSGPPKEFQEGEAGYAIMFPRMEGVDIRPFHFCKRTISESHLEEAGWCDRLGVEVMMTSSEIYLSPLSHIGVPQSTIKLVSAGLVLAQYKPCNVKLILGLVYECE